MAKPRELSMSRATDAALIALHRRAWLVSRLAVEQASSAGVTSRAELHKVILKALQPLHLPRSMRHLGQKILASVITMVRPAEPKREPSQRELDDAVDEWVLWAIGGLMLALVGEVVVKGVTVRSETYSLLSIVVLLESGDDVPAVLARNTVRALRRMRMLARRSGRRFVGESNELVQRAMDIRRYVWRTCRDNRVRDAHRAREGKTFEWAHPPRGGHPGQAHGCRCWARPVDASA